MGGVFDVLERQNLDHRFRIRSKRMCFPPRITFLLVDPMEMEVENYLKRIVEAGAKVIAFDTFFINETVIESFLAKEDTTILYPARFILKQDKKLNASMMIAPYTDLDKIRSRIYHTNIIEDRDGVVRRIHPFIKYKGTHFPALPVLVSSKCLGIKVQDLQLPKGNGLLVNYYNDPGMFELVHPSKLIKGDLDLRGRIVIVGKKGPWHNILTPIGEISPSHLYANIITNILREDFLVPIPELLSIFIVLLLGGLIGWIVSFARSSVAFLVSTILLGSYILIVYTAFIEFDLLMPFTTPLIGGLFSYLGTTILRCGLEERPFPKP